MLYPIYEDNHKDWFYGVAMLYPIYEDNPKDWFYGVAMLYSLQTIQHCHYIKSMPLSK
jgi:hypothetical protein